MSAVLPIVWLARHGETAWSLSGQHTGLTDLPLTERGELNAQSLSRRLQGITFAKVFTSPLKRATRTCELAGFGSEARPTVICWNGITVNMRDVVQMRFTSKVPTGTCFGTVVRGERHRIKSGTGPIVSWRAFATFQVTSWCFRAGIFSGSWPRAG
jgi:Histidine phosphatase superfamily (branch 1)